MRSRFSKAILRFGPALVVMLVIFLFSAMPGEAVIEMAGPVITQAPQTVAPLTSGGTPIRIHWLKVGHVVGYGLLGAAYLHALGPNRQGTWFWATLAAGLYALTDEFHQQFIPGRGAGLQDVVIDTGAAWIVVMIQVGGKWLVGKFKKTN